MALKITKKSPKKPFLITLIVVLVAAGGYTAYAWQANTWPFTEKPTSSSEHNQSDATNNQNDTPIENGVDNSDNSPAEPGSESPNHTPPKYDTPTNEVDASQNQLTGVITTSQVKNDTLIIRTTINQHVQDGQCDLTLRRSSDGKIITKTANIIADPSASTCKGFDIPASELGPGNWQITIDLKSGGQTGRLKGAAQT